MAAIEAAMQRLEEQAKAEAEAERQRQGWLLVCLTHNLLKIWRYGCAQKAA